MMDFAVLFLIINLVIFAAVAWYFSAQRSQIIKQQEMNVELVEVDAKTREEIQQAEKTADEHARFVLKESENLANGLIFDLEKAIGAPLDDPKFTLPRGVHMEADLVTMKDTVRKLYVEKIRQLLVGLQDFQISEAKKFEEFAEKEQEETDVNLQKMRIEMLEKTRLKLDEYKKEEIALFNAKVKKVVDEAAQDLLGHALTNEEHEELILQAVKAARERNGI